MSKSSSSVSLIAVLTAGLALFSWLTLSCTKASHDISDGDESADETSVMKLIGASSQGKSTELTLLDFPPAADMPATPLSARPRRPVHMSALASPSAGVLSLVTGGEGAYRPQSPATVTYGVKLQLDLSESEDDLKKRFLLGGDRGGADVMAMGLERFVASLPELIVARPRIFALVAYSRGGMRLVSHQATAIDALRNATIAYVPEDGGRYFLDWRLLKEGVNPSGIDWLETKTPAEALKAMASGKALAAMIQSSALGGIEEVALQAEKVAEASNCDGMECPASAEASADEDKNQAQLSRDTNASTEDDAKVPQKELIPMRHLASTADAPLLTPIVLVARGDFSVRYPEVLKRIAKAVIAEGALSAEAPLAASRRLREIYPSFEAPEILLSEEPMASLSDNRAFFGLSRAAASPVPFSELLRSMIRVLKFEGRLPSELRGATAEALFLKAPLESLSDRSIASAKTASKAARQKGKIQDPPAVTSDPSSLAPRQSDPTHAAEQPLATTSENSDAPAKDSVEPKSTDGEQTGSETCMPSDV